MTPTRNRAELLEWTLRSVHRQSYPNVEHIVMDGASTDGTLDLLRRLEKPFRLQWHSKPDTGMYPAINEGLGLAEGEILAYLNSDDLYFPWTVEMVVDAFRRHPEAAFVFGDALAIDDRTGIQRMHFAPPFDLDYIRRVGYLAQPTVFWRRAAFESVGPFDETLRYVADCDYWMRAGSKHRFHKINEFLAVERDHPSTLREAVGSPLWAEVEAVRARYVSRTGRDNRIRTRLHGWRLKAWIRACTLLLGMQSLVPSAIRRGPWARFLNSSGADLSKWRLFFHAVPWLGRIRRLDRAFQGETLRPSRIWLEPPL